MKSTITTLVTLLMAFALNAQTFNYSNYSTSLTSTLSVALAENLSFNPALVTTTGTGVTWDASALTAQSGFPAVNFIFGSPAATPHASLYPASNYVQYDPALTAVVEYEYLIVNADSVTIEGSYTPSTAHEIFQDPDKSLVFPFAYGQSFTDSYAKTNYSDASTISSFQTGTRTTTFNGFGTLILPQGSFNNVALFSSERTNSLGPNSFSYTWIDINNGNRLLYVSENNGSVTIAYNTILSTVISTLEWNGSVNVFPNPFSTSANLIIETNGDFENANVEIIDIHGRIVKSVKVETKLVELNKDGLSNGIYTYRLSNNNKIVAYGKLVLN